MKSTNNDDNDFSKDSVNNLKKILINDRKEDNSNSKHKNENNFNNNYKNSTL